MVKIEDVTFRYGSSTILESASMEIGDNSIVSLLGESGIGKSTVAKLLTGLVLPEEGTILMDDIPLSSPEGYDRKLGLSVQMVFQNPYGSLDPRQKIKSGFRELVAYHRFAGKAEADDFIRSATESVNLQTETLNHLPSQISGGEAQRIALSKALMFSPRLLILDEATSMLDVSTQANVLALAKRRMVENGGSILLITHDHKLAEKYSDQTYVIEGKKTRRTR